MGASAWLAATGAAYEVAVNHVAVDANLLERIGVNGFRPWIGLKDALANTPLLSSSGCLNCAMTRNGTTAPARSPELGSVYAETAFNP